MKKFEMAPQDRVEAVRPIIDEILRALGFEEALVTDESKISDFRPFPGSESQDKWESRLRIACIRLSRPDCPASISEADYLVDMAERLQAQREGKVH